MFMDYRLYQYVALNKKAFRSLLCWHLQWEEEEEEEDTIFASAIVFSEMHTSSLLLHIGLLCV